MNNFIEYKGSANAESKNSQEVLGEDDLNLELEKYVLHLYVAGNSPKSVRAIQKLKTICQEYLQGRYELEIIDIYQQPELLEQEQIFAVPTLIKKLPPPLQRLIGDMTNTEKIIVSLGL